MSSTRDETAVDPFHLRVVPPARSVDREGGENRQFRRPAAVSYKEDEVGRTVCVRVDEPEPLGENKRGGGAGEDFGKTLRPTDHGKATLRGQGSDCGPENVGQLAPCLVARDLLLGVGVSPAPPQPPERRVGDDEVERPRGKLRMRFPEITVYRGKHAFEPVLFDVPPGNLPYIAVDLHADPGAQGGA